jgi:uncharacterized repeat protein (TIGR03803 family)
MPSAQVCNFIPTTKSFYINKFAALCLAIAVFGLFSAQLFAQTITKKTLSNNYVDVYNGGIQASDGNFYSTTIVSGFTPIASDCIDGSDNVCTYITKIAPDGTASIFHTFETGDSVKNVEGFAPNPIIEGSDGNFYGSTLEGGAYGAGTIFKITKSGAFSLIYTFPILPNGGNAPSGIGPGPIIQGSDGNFYGTTWSAGPLVNNTFTVGTVFKVTPAGVFTTLHTFPAGAAGNPFTNPDGSRPISLLQASDGNFYGTTLVSSYDFKIPSSTGQGTIFSMTPDGAFTTLHNFALDGSDGISPQGPLAQGPDGNLYGTTGAFGFPGAPTSPVDGKSFFGNFFKISTTGNFQVLYNFTGGTDGDNPNQHLTVGSDGNFYGSARFGGNPTGCTFVGGCGVIFQMQPSGTENIVHSFLDGKDNSFPAGPLVQLNDGSFFGTTQGLTVAGEAYNIAYLPALKGPIHISFVPSTVDANKPVKLTWQVLNAFSTTMQQCHASIVGSPTGAGSWSGPQVGSPSSAGFGATTTITPTVEGTYTYALNCGGRETGFGTLIVGNQLTVATTVLSNATVGTPYSQAILATGGTPPYTWTITSGSAPSGLSFDPATGIVSGTPDQFGDTALVVQVKDSATPTASVATGTVGLSVKSGLNVDTTALTSAIVNTKYVGVLAASGGKPPYSWSLVSGVLPDGIAFSPSTGVFSGTPTKTGGGAFNVLVKDSEGTAATAPGSVTLAIVAPKLAILTPNIPSALVGTSYSQVIATTGGTLPLTWTLTAGTLPRGVAFGSGNFSGTPLQFGSGVASIKVVDSSTPQMTATASFTLAVNSGLSITTTGGLSDGKIGTPYSTGLVATGGVTPYKWVITSGTLPIGLTLATDSGIISGTPTTQQIASFTVQITDSEGTPASSNASFTVNIAPAALAVSTTALSSSSASTVVGVNVTFTAAVSSTSSTPNGTVTFYSGTTALGTGTLNTSGIATLTTAFSAAGSYSITAAYSGNTTITGSTSAPLTETVVVIGVSAAVSPSSLTITAGSSGTIAITLTPTGGYTGTVTFSCGSLPAHVSCTFAPPSVALTATSGPITDTLTITTSVPTATAMLVPNHPGAEGLSGNRSLATLALLLPCSMAALFGLRRRGIVLPRLLVLALLGLGLASATSLTGCGGSSNNAVAGTYSIPVTLSVAGGVNQIVSTTIIVK